MTVEKRIATEVRAEGRKLTGYAATFNQETRISDFREKIAPGAFAASLRSNPDILALVDHDPSRVLARTKSGTLRLSEDERGLKFEIDIPETSAGRDVLALAMRGDLGGMSFGFTVPDGGDSWQGDKRELRSVTLHEISVVQSFPAYGGTSVQARSRQQRSEADRRLAVLELEAQHVAL
ncbi:HK97 family phage prohead protease [Sinorhizobium medicae]|uniref:HK97 family phage prohead protease n=1 Tax=Sinorhizobium medicae TaxID=110321 RepID=UPI000FDBFC1F|nr:HK97 family phage prohead protease [Sinorhizobium medicae]MDX0623486.1 HK97 family phage prohead protease [Sinorhizobium medicae]RVQ49514.1 HK97 family phage prohead protease [Sinorhizobium medicae]